MKLRIVSDLHIDSNWTLPFELPVLPDDAETVLIIAGDAGEQMKATDNIREWLDRFKHVVYVMGNHEYYNGSMVRTIDKIKVVLPSDKLTILDASELQIDDTVFIGATLWTDFEKESPIVMWDASQSMNDYRKIRTGGKGSPYARKFKPIDALAIHKQHLAYIKSRIAHWTEHNNLTSVQHKKRIIVITHHAPSFQSVSPIYANSRLNGCYATALDELLESANIKLWIHGHMHNKSDYTIGNCRVLCNPRGYQTKHEGERTGFDPNFTVEL